MTLKNLITEANKIVQEVKDGSIKTPGFNYTKEEIRTLANRKLADLSKRAHFEDPNAEPDGDIEYTIAIAGREIDEFLDLAYPSLGPRRSALMPQTPPIKEAFKVKLARTFAWDLIGESGSPNEGRDELINVLISVHNDAIDAAHEQVYSTIDESRANVLKLKIV